MRLRFVWLRAISAVVTFTAFSCFLGLIGMQIYRWFRDGEWTRISISDGLLSLVTSCCVHVDDAGTMAAFTRWLEAPQSWLGLHRVLEVLPATIGLFLLSVFWNFLYIYCSDRLDAAGPPPAADQ
ncbi:MAG: hypothetical protein ACHQIL_01780 [Steroidobacterales bacterium]